MHRQRSLAFAFTLLAGSCFAAEVDDARRTFDDYTAAVLARKGGTAADLITTGTIKEYQRFVDLARTADRKTLEGLGITDRIHVISLRHRVPAEDLRKLDGRSAFIYAVDHDWIGKEGVIHTTLGQIEVTGDKAAGEILVDGKKTPKRFQFIKEGNQWRYNLLSLMGDADKAFKESAKTLGVTENDLIFQIVESVSGKKVPDTIWDPVK